YFYSVDCPHCQRAYEEVIQPLQAQYGAKLDLRMVEISQPENYELLIQAETTFQVTAEQRGLPTLIIGDQILIGEDQVRQRLPDLVSQGVANGGLDWPTIPGFDPQGLNSRVPTFGSAEGSCEVDNAASCETAAPIYAAYFYQVGCQACSRVEADLTYLHNRYPQLIVEEFNVYDQAALGLWLAKQAGREKDFHTPALFIGDKAWIGESEITPQSVSQALDSYVAQGAPKTWEAFDEAQEKNGLVERFRSMGWLAVVFAGLVDGLNPCAFATLIFFVSYLTLSGRRGREVLLVGGAFTVGVFLAYLLIGLGLYKILDLMGSWLAILGRWVYALTAILCFGLAIFSFLDYLKARQGKIEDMSLNLPHALRLRINAIIRQGRSAEAYAVGAFATGLVISFLELACTGQIYLPTIIFVSSIPELRLRAIAFLVLYNVLFILPLVVVFILAYYGTTSKDLTRFLQRHAAAVKLGMVILFLSLASWLTISLIP
ncbi:MAG: hypothetical protein GYA59_16330, partial [Chloroflexi bacterium]|nr:hypothetical protein [Chloroflexota bacterium]